MQQNMIIVNKDKRRLEDSIGVGIPELPWKITTQLRIFNDEKLLLK